MADTEIIPDAFRKKNESEAHQRMSQQALRWLANRADMRGVRGAVEIQVDGWKRADAVGICCLNIDARRKYGALGPGNRTDIALGMELVCVFESKTSVSDYKKDFPRNEWFKPPLPGHLRWVVVNFKKPDKHLWPRHWGVIQATGPNGRTLREIVKPTLIMQEWETIVPVYRQLLWRRRHLVVLPCPDCGVTSEEEKPKGEEGGEGEG